MKAEGRRQSRISDLIREKIAELIIEGIKDPQVRGFITVTRVEVTADFKLARVFVSMPSEEKERRNMLAGLKRATGFIKGCLGKDLGLRFIPELEFKLDDSLDVQQRIDDLLKQAKKK